MPPKKSKKSSDTSSDSETTTKSSRRRAAAPKSNLGGIAQRVAMIIDNLTFDDDSPEKHIRRNVTTAIKHLHGVVDTLNRST